MPIVLIRVCKLSILKYAYHTKKQASPVDSFQKNFNRELSVRRVKIENTIGAIKPLNDGSEKYSCYFW